MTQNLPQTSKLKQLVNDYQINPEQLDRLVKITEELSLSGDTPTQDSKETIQAMWSFPSLPAVFIHIIYTSYTLFEYLECCQDQNQLSILRSIIYLSAQIAEIPSSATEMLSLKFPVYFFPILKSKFTPEDIKSLIVSLFIVILKQTDGQFFIRNEVSSILIYELANTKSTTIHGSLILLQTLIDKQPHYYNDQKRKRALLEALQKYVQQAQPYGQRSDIQKNISIASSIITKIEKLEA
ncbi:Cell_differentiation family [Hexamita inflata]|uniref:Rcd1-like domain-containing protein n=1 Tax=Hexamita inflata TaxID=28002 RepID=A0AA86P8H2_9EUKA|nr:Cell differentiation family [Hexamita inflata]CAI9933713.1 Cell differentiation family [Hexamita inflata]